MLGLFNVNKSFGRLQGFKCLAQLNLSTKPDVSGLKHEIKRRFEKPIKKRELQHSTENFLHNTFGGKFNSKVFEYPSSLEDNETDLVIQHSFELENLLNRTSKSKITEEILRELRKIDSFGLSIPQKYGGSGYTETETAFLYECIGVNPKIAKFMSYNELAARLILKFGTEEQKQEYLPNIAAGQSFVTFAFLENGHLIDFSSLKGTAFKDGAKRGFLINATKKYVHNANISDLIIVLSKTKFIEDGNTTPKLIFYLINKNTPGVTVYERSSKAEKELGLYDVTLDNVFVDEKNVLGNIYDYGPLILKSAISQNALFDSAICCSLLKRMVHFLSIYCTEKTGGSKSELMQTSLGTLNVIVYALESVIYFITGKYDLFKEPDLINECILAKVLALDFLQLAIEKYIQITGFDCLKSPGIFEEAFKDLQYYSAFQEKSLNLKLMICSDGLQIASNALVQKVKEVRQGHEHPWQSLRFGFSSNRSRAKENKKKYNLKLDLNISLEDKADLLEEELGKFQVLVENHFMKFGNEALKQENLMIKFADMAAYIFAWTLSLSRSSSFYCRGYENAELDIQMAEVFSDFAAAKIGKIQNELNREDRYSEDQKLIGETSFKKKMYPAEHPLTRTY